VIGMALAHCILGKFLGVVCHCFPPVVILDGLIKFVVNMGHQDRGTCTECHVACTSIKCGVNAAAAQ